MSNAVQAQSQEQDVRLRLLTTIMRSAFDSLGAPTMGSVNQFCLRQYQFTPAIDPDDWEEFFLIAWRDVDPELFDIRIDPHQREPEIRWVNSKPAA